MIKKMTGKITKLLKELKEVVEKYGYKVEDNLTLTHFLSSNSFKIVIIGEMKNDLKAGRIEG